MTTSSSYSISRTTLALMAVSVVFFFSYFPAIIALQFYENIRKRDGYHSHVQLGILRFFLAVSYVQNVANPFIYYIFSGRFREATHELFRKWFRFYACPQHRKLRLSIMKGFNRVFSLWGKEGNFAAEGVSQTFLTSERTTTEQKTG